MRLSHCLRFVLGVSLLTSQAYAGTLTLRNNEPVTVQAKWKANGTTIYTDNIPANSEVTKTDSAFDSPAALTGSYVHPSSGVTFNGCNTVTSGGTVILPSTRFHLIGENNTGATRTGVKIKRNGTTIITIGTLTAGTGFDDPLFTMEQYGGAGTLTVTDDGGAWLPVAGYASSAYVRGCNESGGTMTFTVVAGTTNVTRSVTNNYGASLKVTFYRDGVLQDTQYINAGEVASYTHVVATPGSYVFREDANFLTLSVNGDGNLEPVYTSGGEIATGSGPGGSTVTPANLPDQPPKLNAGDLITGGSINWGTNSPTGAATEGSFQAGTEGVIKAIKDNTAGIVAALDGLTNSVNVSVSNAVSVTNALTITNIGDTNLVERWDYQTNRGAQIEAAVGNATNYAQMSNNIPQIGTSLAVVDSINANAMTTPGSVSTGPWLITIAGMTIDANPVNSALFGPLISSVKEWIRYLILGLYTWAVFRRLDDVLSKAQLPQQARIPQVTIFGNNVGAALATVVVTTLATLMVTIPTVLLGLWQGDANVATFISSGSTLFTGAAGPVQMAVGLFEAFVPLDTLFTCIVSLFVVYVKSRAILWLSSMIIRFLIA